MTTIGAQFDATIAATEDGTQEHTAALYERARYRVEHITELQPYADLILSESWYDDAGDDHWIWVYDAPVSEIIEWVEVIARDLDN